MKLDKITDLEGKELNKGTELNVGDKIIIHSGSERYRCKVVSRDDDNNKYDVDVAPIYSIAKES